MVDKEYYVYKHVGKDGEIVYVGSGVECRAFRSVGSGHRDKEHSDWLNSCYQSGYIPVEFEKVGLSKKSANELEKSLIKAISPKFNKLHNASYKRPHKWDSIKSTAVELYEKTSMGYRNVAYLLGFPTPKNSVMTIKRIVSNG